MKFAAKLWPLPAIWPVPVCASLLPPHPGPLPREEGATNPVFRQIEALWFARRTGDVLEKRQRTAAVQDAGATADAQSVHGINSRNSWGNSLPWGGGRGEGERRLIYRANIHAEVGV